MEKFELSNGDVIEIKPFTMKQASQCKFFNLLKKLAKSSDGKDADAVDITKLDLSEDEIVSVVRQVYPKVLDLDWLEAFELFGKILEVNFKKK